MPPPRRFPPDPARSAVARINERVGRIGREPLPLPSPHVTLGLGPVADVLRGIDARGGGGGGRGRAEDPAAAIRRGAGAFDSSSGQGRAEQALRSVVADIEEARANGTIGQDEADRYLRRAADISEGLYAGMDPEDMPEWLSSDEAIKAVIVGPDHEKSAVDRVLDAGGNALTGVLREISRPGEAVLSGFAERAAAGAENPLRAGPLRVNRAFLGPINEVMGALGDREAQEVTAASMFGAKAGATLRTRATPTTLFEETGINPAVRKLGLPVGVVDNPVTHVLTRAGLDPTTYIGFGASPSIRAALRAADNVVPGAAATLRRGGLAALSAADREAIEAALGPRAMAYLRGAQGGIRVRAPFGRYVEGESVIAGETLRAPFRAAKSSAPARAVADSALGQAAKGVGRTLERALVPRAAVRRALGDPVERVLDDVRVALGHGAGQRTQRELDRVINVARSIPDLSMDEVRQVTAALDVGGAIDQLPERLRPLADAFDEWRQGLTQAQVDEGVLIGREARDRTLVAARDARAEELADLFDQVARVDERIAKRTAEAEAVLPDLEPAARRATDAGYAGGRADAVLESVPSARRQLADAGGRVEVLEGRVERHVDAMTPRATPVDAPIKAVDRKEARALVDDVAKRADDALRSHDIVGTGVPLPPIPKPKKRVGVGFKSDQLVYPPEWEWVAHIDGRTRAAYLRASAEHAGATGLDKGAREYFAPDVWQEILGTDTVDQAVEQVLDSIRVRTSLEQLSRGSRPWWPERLPIDLSQVEREVVDALPEDKVAGYAAAIGRRAVAKTSLGQTLDRVDKLLREAGRPGAGDQLRAQGWRKFIGTLSGDEMDLLQARLRDKDWDNLMGDVQGGALVHVPGRRTPGRKSWKAGDLDEVVRSMRQGRLDELERELAEWGEELAPWEREYIEPGFLEGQRLGRLEGQVTEAELDQAAAARSAAAAERRAAGAAGKAERAADRAIEAQQSIQRQASRASEQSLERGKKVAQATRTLQIKKAKLRQEVRRAEKALAEAEAAVLRGTVADEDYFPRILTPDAVRVMEGIEDGRLRVDGVVGVRSSVAGDKFVTARRPEWATKSIDEINLEMAPVMEEARRVGIIKGDGPVEWFDSNPFTAFAQRDVVARRHIVGKQFYDRLTQLVDDEGRRIARNLDGLPPVEFGPRGELMDVDAALRYVESLPSGAPGARERLARLVTGGDEWVFVEVPSLGVGVPPRTIMVRREIADELGRVARTFADPGPLLRFMDQWQALWKAYATVPLPFGLGFHLRNAQGNVFLNWLHGLSSVGPYRRAARLQMLANKGVRRFGDPFALVRGTSDESLLREALDRGVIGGGWFDIDVGPTGRFVADSRGRVPVKGTGRSAWQAANPFSTDFVLIDQGRRFGSSVEHNARLAHFIWRMDSIADPAEAARSVRRALFDYSDVTGFERGVVKRLVPFYTFMRKSAPTVIEGFVTNPSKLSRIQQVRMALAEDAGAPEGLYPEFLAEAAGVPLPISLGGDQLVLTPDLPVLATAQNLTDALAVAGALPLVPQVTDRTPSEGAQGLFSQVSGGLPGALSAAVQAAQGRRFFGGTELGDRNVEASLPARMLPPFLGGPRWRDVDGDGDLEPSMTQRADFMLESLFPLASKVPFGTRSEADKTTRRLVSMLTGLRVYPLGESTRNFEGYRRADELERFLDALAAQGRLTKGVDAEAVRDRTRAEVEAQVRAELGLDESYRLTDEARALIDARMRRAA